MRATLAVLTRDPTPGRVKTRLIPALGAEGAARLHWALVAETLKRAHRSGLPVTVHLDGDLDGEFAAFLRGSGAEVVVQRSGGLGERIAGALHGAGRRLVIGSDCPNFRPEWLQDAASDSAPVQLGPAADGGYWLLGVEGPAEPLLVDIPWSTDQVLAVTMARARAECLDVGLLPTCADVDLPADLDRLAADPETSPRLRATLQSIRAGLPATG